MMIRSPRIRRRTRRHLRRHPRRRTGTFAALFGAALVAACAGQPEFAGFDPAREVVIPETAVKFVNINPAIKMGAAYGNRGTGGHGSFGTFPAAFITPFHTHSGAYHGIVIAGTMTNPFKGEKTPLKMGAGSCWYVPAGSVHATACVSETPCRFYFHAASAFDFTPREEVTPRPRRRLARGRSGRHLCRVRDTAAMSGRHPVGVL